MKLLQFTALLFSLVSVTAHAQEGRFYGGGALGASHHRFNKTDFGVQGTVPDISRDTSDGGYKVFGGYRLNNHLAAEIAYTDFGRATYQMRATTNGLYAHQVFRFSYQSQALSGSLKGDWDISQQFKMIGRLGASYNMARTDYSIDYSNYVAVTIPPGITLPQLTESSVYDTPGRHKKSRVSLLWGIGVEYKATENINIRLEYEDHGRFGSPAATGRSRLSMTSLGLVYSF